ncbi:ABC transporter family substrate-binding protein [Glaciihabitans sp. UYNi722]|uniref:ABC transporter family substrate-binding protein n=1 Tax=Glaciihabitans sp. UYNi722 TaxID=3156344 RepID=UPI0033934CCC
MKLKRSIAALAAVIAGVLVLSGCTNTVVHGTEVTVATSQPFTSYNPKTSFGNASANSTIVYATNSQFNYYDNTSKLQKDESFGSYQVVSRAPFRVKYTIKAGVKWSDGTPVDASDLLLAWAANSGVLNTAGFDNSDYLDAQTGEYTRAFPPGVVHFDGFSGNGLQLVTKTPVIGDGGRSLTLSYDKFFVDWQLVFGVGLPAHVVAKHALGIDSPQKAKDAMVAAIQKNDTAKLAKIARFWDTGFNFASMPKDKDLVVGSGPYTITDFVADDHLTLTANPEYTGDHRPQFERVVMRFITDPLAAVEAFRKGDVDVIAPQPSADIAKELVKIKNATVLSGADGSYEHLDLQFDHSRSGAFNDPLVRRAFLKTVSRQQILDQLIVPLQEDAQLRSSQVFLPGASGYASSVASNGSKDYATVDIPGAKALLAKAGVANPEVCVLFDPSNPRRVAEFTLIQKSAAKAGFSVTDCSSTDWRQLLGADGAYDASLYALRPTSLAVTAVAASFRSDSTINNLNFYSNPQVDALIDRLDSTYDEAEQANLLKKIDAMVWADAHGVPLYQFPSVTAVDNRVKGVAPSPLPPNLLWNIWDWAPVETG